MSAITSQTGDFRDEAVTASEKLLAARRRETGAAQLDPLEAGVSYCLPAEGDGRAGLSSLKVKTIIGVVFGILGLAGGALIASRADMGGSDREDWHALLPAAACSLAGFAFLFWGATAQARLVRRMARDRISTYREGATRPVVVSIENGRTFQKLKAIAEDVGAVILHPASRCVQIEGVTHRYMIHADDVNSAEIKDTPNNKALLISYRIEDRTLEIALFDNRLASELKRQTIGGRNKLFAEIQSVLEPERA